MSDEKVGAGPSPGPGPVQVPLPEKPVVGTSNAGVGVTGESRTNVGVSGTSTGIAGRPGSGSDGVLGVGLNGVHGQSYYGGGFGVLGEYVGPGSGEGVLGTGTNGVHGRSVTDGGRGVFGERVGKGFGVVGLCTAGIAVSGLSQAPDLPAVQGFNGGGGIGVRGEGDGGGVFGQSQSGMGVSGTSQSEVGVFGSSQSQKQAGVSGANGGGGIGVRGAGDGGGVFGTSTKSDGIHGESYSAKNAGVYGWNLGGGMGVFGWSGGGGATNAGVFGQSGPGVDTLPDSGSTKAGVYGKSSDSDGVHGQSYSANSAGVSGVSVNGGMGVYGYSWNFDGVRGISHDKDHAGVSGSNESGGPAGHFEGNVEVTGDITLINQDCAEDFNISSAHEIEPGTVMVIQEGDALEISQSPYDKRVAGVISGAGNLKPAVVLGKQSSQNKRMPLALLGKVYCKVDAGYSEVEVGDLLTTSPTPGHAMKAADPNRAFGAVIGKALQPLAEGRGLIPILIALQ